MLIKKIVFTGFVAIIVAVVVVGAICLVQQLPQTSPPEPLPNAVIVFCVRNNAPSEQADQIEAYTRELLEESFTEPYHQGKIILKVLNYEDPKNRQLKEDLSLDAVTLFLGDGRINRPKIAQNLHKTVVDYISDKEAFKLSLRNQIDKFYDE